MKFSDGVWRTAEGIIIASLNRVFDLAGNESEVMIEASSCPYRARFEDQVTVYLRVSLFAPAPNVIGVKLEHFQGLPKRGPAFEITSNPSTKSRIVIEEDFVSLSSGESLEYLIIDGPTSKDVLERYTRLLADPPCRRRGPSVCG